MEYMLWVDDTITKIVPMEIEGYDRLESKGFEVSIYSKEQVLDELKELIESNDSFEFDGMSS